MNEKMENLIFDLEDLKICEEIAKNHMVGRTEGPRGIKEEDFGEVGQTSTVRYEAEIEPKRYVDTKLDFKIRKDKMYRDQFKLGMSTSRAEPSPSPKKKPGLGSSFFVLSFFWPEPSRAESGQKK